MAISVRQARRGADFADVTALWGEYLRWANDQFDAEYGFRLDVEDVLKRNLADLSPFDPPTGRLLLAFDGDTAVGVGCLQKLRPGTAEIKRMFVRPSARGRGIGRLLLDRLVEAAQEIGCDHVLLDSTRFMHAAHALYRSVRFNEIEPYPESEIPTEVRHHWLFMRLSFDDGPWRADEAQ
jgi:GNAT superfamily N-acetyltransferase